MKKQKCSSSSRRNSLRRLFFPRLSSCSTSFDNKKRNEAKKKRWKEAREIIKLFPLLTRNPIQPLPAFEDCLLFEIFLWHEGVKKKNFRRQPTTRRGKTFPSPSSPSLLLASRSGGKFSSLKEALECDHGLFNGRIRVKIVEIEFFKVWRFSMNWHTSREIYAAHMTREKRKKNFSRIKFQFKVGTSELRASFDIHRI